MSSAEKGYLGGEDGAQAGNDTCILRCAAQYAAHPQSLALAWDKHKEVQDTTRNIPHMYGVVVSLTRLNTTRHAICMPFDPTPLAPQQSKQKKTSFKHSRTAAPSHTAAWEQVTKQQKKPSPPHLKVAHYRTPPQTAPSHQGSKANHTQTSQQTLAERRYRVACGEPAPCASRTCLVRGRRKNGSRPPSSAGEGLPRVFFSADARELEEVGAKMSFSFL